jgi:Peptidase family S41
MRFILTVLFFSILGITRGQQRCNDIFSIRYTVAQLNEDLDFIREKILNVHINPFTEVSESEFESSISAIRGRILNGMSQKDFYLLVRPVFVRLNDEHARISDYCMSDSIESARRILPLKFRYFQGKALLSENISKEPLNIGDELVSINGITLNKIIDECSNMAIADSDQRKAVVVEQLGRYLGMYCFFMQDSYQLRFSSGQELNIKCISVKEFDELDSVAHPAVKIAENVVSYRSYSNSGYLKINSFPVNEEYTMARWGNIFDSLFANMKEDGIRNLLIDVSSNGGGNSAVGNMLMSYITNREYMTYGAEWKKSEEYATYMKKLGNEDRRYFKTPNGEILQFSSQKRRPVQRPNGFSGTTYIIVGPGTFSSAMMFATVIKDNGIAKLAGEEPKQGHPNHFGELIMFKTLHTQIDFGFSVKEWIRPSGKKDENRLKPDIAFSLNDLSPEEIINKVLK